MRVTSLWRKVRKRCSARHNTTRIKDASSNCENLMTASLPSRHHPQHHHYDQPQPQQQQQQRYRCRVGMASTCCPVLSDGWVAVRRIIHHRSCHLIQISSPAHSLSGPIEPHSLILAPSYDLACSMSIANHHRIYHHHYNSHAASEYRRFATYISCIKSVHWRPKTVSIFNVC